MFNIHFKPKSRKIYSIQLGEVFVLIKRENNLRCSYLRGKVGEQDSSRRLAQGISIISMAQEAAAIRRTKVPKNETIYF